MILQFLLVRLKIVRPGQKKTLSGYSDPLPSLLLVNGLLLFLLLQSALPQQGKEVGREEVDTSNKTNESG